MLLLFVFGCGLLISIFLGFIAFRRFSTYDRIVRFLILLLPFAIVLCLELIILRILQAPLEPWNAIRLGPSFILKNHFQLYYKDDVGPIISGLNAPILPLVYLPTTLGSTPTDAMIIGSALAAIFFFIPIGWLHFYNIKKMSPEERLFAWGAFLCFCFFVFRFKSLTLSAFWVHADAPALGFSGLACTALYERKQPFSPVLYFLSALCAVLSAFCKVTFLPILVALPFYLFLCENKKNVFYYLLYLGFCIIAVSIIFILWHGVGPVFYNMWTSNLASRWIGGLYNVHCAYSEGLSGRIKVFSEAGIELLQEYYWFLIFLISHFIFKISFRKEERFNLSGFLGANVWLMPVIVSFFMLPTSLAGRVKWGGIQNTQSPTVYFLIASVTLTLLDAATVVKEKGSDLRLKGGRGLLITLLLVLMITSFPDFLGRWRSLEHLQITPHEVAFKYAKKHPGIAYFPDYPLSSLMGEGKVYHSASGIIELQTRGFVMTQNLFRAYIPNDLKLVAFYGSSATSSIMQYLPEFSSLVEDPELPGWKVYKK